MGNSQRQFPRVPISLAVSYRSAGSLLIAYSVNLSKGGLFIEATPLAVGTQVEVDIEIPGADRQRVAGVVAWVRLDSAEGQPTGMGIRFSTSLDESFGEQIDRLASGFAGLSMLVMSTRDDRRQQLERSLRSIVACDCISAETPAAAEAALAKGVDLVLVDLDGLGVEGLEVMRLARTCFAATPAIALSTDSGRREWAVELGATRALPSPPPFADLQSAVIGGLIRPTIK